MNRETGAAAVREAKPRESDMKRNVAILNLATLLLWMAMYWYVPILPAYAQSLGATATMIGVIGGSYGLMQVLLRAPLGVVSDRLGRDRLLLVIGFLTLVASALLFLFLKDIVWVLVARTLAGMGAAWWVILSTSYGKYYSEETQVKAQGVINAYSNAGKLVAVLAGGVLVQFLGYPAAFAMALACSAAGMVLVLGLKPVEAHNTREKVPFRYMWQLLRNKPLMGVSVLALIGSLVSFAAPMTFAIVAAKALGADSIQLGLMSFIYFGGALLANLFVATKAYRRLGGIRSMVLFFLIGAVACVPMFYTQSVGLIFLMQFLTGISFGATSAAFMGMALKCADQSHRGAAMGMHQSVYAFGILFGPIITGAMVDAFSFDVSFWLICAMGVAGAVLCVLLIPREFDKMT